MTIADKLNTIDTALDDIKTALIAKGQTPTGDITTYATAVNNLPPIPLVIPREVDANGKYDMPTTSFTFSLPSNATDVGSYALYFKFYGCTGLTSVDLSSLTTISGSSALSSAFRGCTGLTSVNLSSLTTIRNASFGYTFYGCTGLTSVDLSNLTSVSGTSVLGSAFYGCTGLTSVDLSSLTTANADNAFKETFHDCTSLTSVNLNLLKNLKASSVLSKTFYGCRNLTTLSFPALTSTSFSFYTNQFNNMLQGVKGCTVHFPSNLQGVIGSWTSVTAGFGGTNTTVLFDLTATT